MTTKNQPTGTDVQRRASLDQLRDVTDFESAIALFQKELGATVVASADLGDGFSLLSNKDELIGRPLMFVHWTYSEGEHGEFVAARVVAELPNKTYAKYVIIDGGSGIYQQLKDVDSRNAGPAILTAPRGLRKSEYDHPVHGHGITHYIDTADAR